MTHVPVAVLLALLIAFAAIALLFVLVPAVDLVVSGLFASPEGGFPWRGTGFERLVYHSLPVLTCATSLSLITRAVWQRRSGQAEQWLEDRKLAYLFLLLAIGPGIIVNALLKEHWGRARPIQVVELGGHRHFSPAFLLSDEGGGSFSSGHAAAAAWLVAVAWLTAQQRALWVGIAIGYALLVGLVRIGAGGHFLSDVLVSYFIVAIAGLILYSQLFLMVSSTGPWARAEASPTASPSSE